MARKRVIYQSEALFCAPTGSHAGLNANHQLLRVQDITHGVELNRTDVNEFGQLAAIERKIIEPPTVSLDFSYYIHGGRNENLMGFQSTDNSVSASAAGLKQALGWIMNGTSDGVGLGTKDERNYYISVCAEGDDSKGANTQTGVIGIGNGAITSYNVEAAVGDIPTSSVSVEANNICFTASGTNVKNPAVNASDGSSVSLGYAASMNNFPMASQTGTTGSNYAYSCLRPGDILINFNDAGNCKAEDATDFLGSPDGSKNPIDWPPDEADANIQMGGAILEGPNTAHVQNFTLDVPMARTPLNRIGNVYPYARELDTPIALTLSVSALLSDIKDGCLNDLLCGGEQKRNIRISMRTPCAGEDADVVMEYLLKGCVLDSQNFSASIGDNKTVDLVFSTQQGGANGTGDGLYMWFDSDATMTENLETLNEEGDVKFYGAP